MFLFYRNFWLRSNHINAAVDTVRKYFYSILHWSAPP